MKELKDEEIVKRVQSGSKEAFGEIVERYEKRLFGYIKNLINQPNEEVEDLLQEVFISAYINIQGFDTRKKFSSWIYRMAHNRAVDYFRTKHKRTILDETNEELVGDGRKLIEELEIEKEEAETVRRAVEKLELKYKEVVMLNFFEDKSYEEISDILHISVSNVGVLLCRAKDKLRKLF